jgi:hypothetical protein
MVKFSLERVAGNLLLFEAFRARAENSDSDFYKLKEQIYGYYR